MSLDLSGLQGRSRTGSLGTARSPTMRPINVRAWHPRRQYNLGGEKLGTRDRQLPLINWSEPRHCDMQEGSAIRPVGRVIERRAAAANHMLVPPSTGQKRHAGCHFSQATFALLQGGFLARRSTPRKCEFRRIV